MAKKASKTNGKKKSVKKVVAVAEPEPEVVNVDDVELEGSEIGSDDISDADINENDEDEESVISEVEIFAKNMTMRSKRGTKISKLLRKQKFEEDKDDFWNNNKYFGSKHSVSKLTFSNSVSRH